MNHPETGPIIEQFKAELERIYGDRLMDIILFGSYARDEATDASDIDLAIVLDRIEGSPGHEIDRMMDAAYDLMLDHAVLLSLYPVSSSDLEHRRSPLLMNIRQEGITVDP